MSTTVIYFDNHNKILLKLTKDFVVIPRVTERVQFNDTVYLVKDIDHRVADDTHTINIYVEDFYNAMMGG